MTSGGVDSAFAVAASAVSSSTIHICECKLQWSPARHGI
jgi:hypothetical protein